MPDPAPSFCAVLVMAGVGRRFGAAEPKAYVQVAGAPMWRHSARTFLGVPGCVALVLVVAAELVDRVRADAATEFPQAIVTGGGARRQDSARHGVEATPTDADVIAIHDAARPLVGADTIAATIRAAAEYGAALAASPARDTVKRVGADGLVAETLDRSELWLAQTPQALRGDVARRVHAAALADGVEVTDDAALAEHYGVPVRVVRSGFWNLKVTEPGDRAVAEALLRQRGEQS